MDVTTKTLSDSCSHLDVRATALEVLRALDDALVIQAVRAGLQPGQGQSVKEALKEATGKDDVDELVRDEVPEVLVYRAVEKSGIVPAVPPKVLKHGDIARGRELTFEVEVLPKKAYELTAYEPLEVTVEEFGVKPEEVDRQIQALVETRATWRTVTDRPVRRGDAARLAVEATMGGKPLASLTTKGRMFEIGSDQMPAGFDAGVIGAAVGETRTFEFELAVDDPADNYSEAGASVSEAPEPASSDPFDDADVLPEPDEIAAQQAACATATVRCTVTVLALSEKSVPEVTDAWVRAEMPRFSCVDDLRASVKGRMEAAGKADYEAYVHSAVLKALVERFDATLDDAVLQRGCEALINDLRLRSNQEGRTYEEVVLEYGGEQQMMFSLMSRAHTTLVRGFALDAVFRHEGLTVSDEDIDVACAQIDPANPKAVRAEMARSGRTFTLVEMAERAKASRWVYDHAVITKVPRS